MGLFKRPATELHVPQPTFVPIPDRRARTDGRRVAQLAADVTLDEDERAEIDALSAVLGKPEAIELDHSRLVEGYTLAKVEMAKGWARDGLADSEVWNTLVRLAVSQTSRDAVYELMAAYYLGRTGDLDSIQSVL